LHGLKGIKKKKKKSQNPQVPQSMLRISGSETDALYKIVAVKNGKRVGKEKRRRRKAS